MLRFPPARSRLLFAAATLACALAGTYTAQPAAAQDEVRCYFVACTRSICSYQEVPCPEKGEVKPETKP
jgi:hypothetical protein